MNTHHSGRGLASLILTLVRITPIKENGKFAIHLKNTEVFGFFSHNRREYQTK